MKILSADSNWFGVRARLLALLLPGIVGLLAVDSWNDQRAFRSIVGNAYDQTMLDSTVAIQNNVFVGEDGALKLNTLLAKHNGFDGTNSQHRHLYVGLIPQLAVQSGNNAAKEERALIGESDLPFPPLGSLSETNSPVVWYDGTYRGNQVRAVALRTTLVDGHGQSFELHIRAAEDVAFRDHIIEISQSQAFLRDARLLLLVVLLVWVGVGWSLLPLKRLRRAVRESDSRQLQPLDSSSVPHEVAPLVNAVNQHVSRYSDLLDKQEQFLADASHQLRTPLAIMMTQAGVALREKETARLHEMLRAITAQLNRSTRLCEQLLSVAHAGSRSSALSAATSLDLNSVAKNVVIQHLSLAHTKNIDLGWVDINEAIPHITLVPVIANEAELYEVLSNLIHNAITHIPPDGCITVAVRLDENRACVEVCDDGPGIVQGRREQVFERFNHSNLGSRDGARGSGLGLAIARAYARRNGGDIVLTDPTGAIGKHKADAPGLCAILQLPLKPER